MLHSEMVRKEKIKTNDSRGLSSVSSPRAGEDRKPVDLDAPAPLTLSLHSTNGTGIGKNLKQNVHRKTLMKQLGKQSAVTHTVVEDQLREVDVNAERIVECVGGLTDALYKTLLEMHTASETRAAAATSVSHVFQDFANIKEELAVVKARNTLLQMSNERHQKQLDILASTLMEIQAMLVKKENISPTNNNNPSALLMQLNLVLKQVAVGTGVGGSRGALTNSDALQQLATYVDENSVVQQVLRCVHAMHADVKKLRLEKKRSSSGGNNFPGGSTQGSCLGSKKSRSLV